MTSLFRNCFGYRWGCVSAVDSNRRTIWIVDVRLAVDRSVGVHADEVLTAFVELERICLRLLTDQI